MAPETFGDRLTIDNVGREETIDVDAAIRDRFGPAIGVVSAMTTEALRLYTALCRQMRDDYSEGRMSIDPDAEVA